MKQQAFERSRAAAWDRFAARLDGVKQGYKLEPDDDPAAFAREYEQLASDLNLARARGYSRSLLVRLNDLVVRGHNVVYVYRTSFLRAGLRFLGGGFAARVRREWRHVAVATALFWLPFMAIWITIAQAPEYVYSVMAPTDVAQLEAMYDPSVRVLGPERQADSDFAMFGFYIWNNISIGFQAFAGGLVFGVLSVFVLVFNGLHIGAAAGHLIGVGFEDTFLSFVAGHSALELTAIVLSGAAGLMLGSALLFPGGQPRGAVLRDAAARAVEIVIGSALMLLAAAFIEAFWSSSTLLPLLLKYAFGVVMWVLVIGYFLFAGRRRGS
jgi:uncharacterized membrane protein SpoIIM required for sporulation